MSFVHVTLSVPSSLPCRTFASHIILAHREQPLEENAILVSKVVHVIIPRHIFSTKNSAM
jgi:hypothetical protein